MKNIIKTTLMMFFAGTIITACDKKTEYPEPNTTVATPITAAAKVMFVHAGADAPEMNFSVDNTVPADAKLTLGKNSAYFPFNIVAPSGGSGTQFRSTVADPAVVLFTYNPGRLDGTTDDIRTVAFRATSGGFMNTSNFTATNGVSYSVFLTDTVKRPANTQNGRSTDIGGPLLNYTIDDNAFLNFATVPTRSVKLRLVHLSPNAPAVRVIVGSQESTSGTVLTATPATPFASVAYRATAPIFTLPVSALTDADNKVVLKNIEVRTVVGNALVLTIPSLSVTMGKAYTLVAVGKVGTASFGVKAIQNN